MLADGGLAYPCVLYLLVTFSDRNFEKGNLINWETAKLELTSMSEEEVPMKDLCGSLKPGHVILAHKLFFGDLANTCGKFHGQVSVVRSREMQAELSSIFASHPECHVWRKPGKAVLKEFRLQYKVIANLSKTVNS